tara:strand:+ start:121 stop:969 length:849 start_codon:yes stop_codon:yes gene_type:complete
MTETAQTGATSETAEAPVEASETVESSATPTEEAGTTETPTETKAADITLSLDDLLNADFGNDEIMGQTHKGLPHYNEVLKHLPEDGRKLIANLRSSYTQKTQEMAAMRKELQAERKALLEQSQTFTDSDFAKNIKEQAALPDVDVDPWSDDGMAAKIKQEATRMMAEMMKPLQQEMKLKERKSQLTTFKSDHPDLMEPSIKQEVAKMLMERQELSLEDAYYIVKAKMSQSQLLELKRAEKEKKDTARSTLNLTKTGAQVNAQGIPQFRNAWEAFQWHKQNS